MGNIQLRLANKDDIPDIIKVCEKIWEGNDYILNVINRWFEDKDAYHFVLEYDGKITHFERLKVQSNKAGWVEGLRGDPDYQGKGLAKKISQYIVDFAKSIKLKTLRAVTYFKNDASICLTIRVGYKIPYRFLSTKKELNELKTNKSDKNNVRILKENELDKVLTFLNKSKVYDEFDRFIVNMWYYEEHSKEKWLELIKNSEVFTLCDESDRIDSLMTIRKRMNRDGYVIGFIDADSEKKLDMLIDYAEYKAVNDGKNLGFVIPQNSRLVSFQKKRGYEPKEDSAGNVLLFELNI